MNLAAYDKPNIIDNNKSWIDTKKKILFSRQLVCRKYIAFGTQYDTEQNYTKIYIILLDEKPEDRPSCKVIINDSGVFKINIKSIFCSLGITTYNDRYINAYLSHTEHTDDGDIYELTI